MLTQERRREIHDAFANEIQGGVSKDWMQIIDEWIEAFDEGSEYFTMSQEEFQNNEIEIATLFDDWFFSCNSCGWTMPIDDMGEDNNGEFRCTDCEKEDRYEEEYDEG